MPQRTADHAINELLVAGEAGVLGNPLDRQSGPQAKADPVAVVDRPVPLDDAVARPRRKQAIEGADAFVPGE
jgi:hypothetical protein